MTIRFLLLTLPLWFFSLWGEEVVRMEKPIPNRLLRQGELKVIQNGTNIELRIELKTRHLEKVRDKIIQAETENWPNSADSLQYLKAINATSKTALHTGKGKINFRIIWILQGDEQGSIHLVTDTQKVVLPEFSPHYLKRNMALILADNFDFSEAEALVWIETIQQELP